MSNITRHYDGTAVLIRKPAMGPVQTYQLCTKVLIPSIRPDAEPSSRDLTYTEQTWLWNRDRTGKGFSKTVVRERA